MYVYRVFTSVSDLVFCFCHLKIYASWVVILWLHFSLVLCQFLLLCGLPMFYSILVEIVSLCCRGVRWWQRVVWSVFMVSIQIWLWLWSPWVSAISSPVAMSATGSTHNSLFVFVIPALVVITISRLRFNIKICFLSMPIMWLHAIFVPAMMAL